MRDNYSKMYFYISPYVYYFLWIYIFCFIKKLTFHPSLPPYFGRIGSSGFNLIGPRYVTDVCTALHLETSPHLQFCNTIHMHYFLPINFISVTWPFHVSERDCGRSSPQSPAIHQLMPVLPYGQLLSAVCAYGLRPRELNLPLFHKLKYLIANCIMIYAFLY